MAGETLESFLKRQKRRPARGPVALVFAEDRVELASTLRHHLNLGFGSVLALMPDAFDLPPDLNREVQRIAFDSSRPAEVFQAVNRVIGVLPGTWLYYCYNAEYLYFPFCETRSIGEMLAFHGEERRDAMLTYVVDLYAGDLSRHPTAVSLDSALLDRSGYYALARIAPDTGAPRERQLDFFGGLRWRFEEHVPENSRRIDRIALFRTRPGLRLNPDHTFNDQEYNTYACPWHHNLTAAVCSFRAAKALKRNPGSRHAIDSFCWRNSTPFDWTSGQLLDLGLMEPGQWF
ncbi:hypothetical protein QO034_16720 [Sedimentitalea sp. JM2-8]|uniref:Glycosyl transferase family 2 n=1 Tax=Sedimentitalea xiamensis TaxID=3050037 RepID=A0ABT7FHX1_9RHOB|nr:hypothetical protein [Sedimentitalea xiamensis]MDK3074734.1 hypothetical protein [Sedimentitalea xiamensis]